jgi:hypothetical protein
VAGTCEYGNVVSGSIKCGEFLDYLQNQLASQEGLFSTEQVSKYISELILDSIPSSHPVIQLVCNLPFVPCGTKCSHWALPTTCYIVHVARGFTRSFSGRRTIPGSSYATGKRVFYPPKCPVRIWDTSSLLLNGYRDYFPAENGRGVKLTTYLHLLSRLNISRSTRSICLHCVYRDTTVTVSRMGLWGCIDLQVLTDPTNLLIMIAV